MRHEQIDHSEFIANPSLELSDAGHGEMPNSIDITNHYTDESGRGSS